MSNTLLADFLAKIANYYKAIHNYKARQFSEASAKIRTASLTITNGKMASTMFIGIGPSISTEIDQFLTTGTSQRLLQLEKDYGQDMKEIINMLSKIYGVGQVVANKMYQAGVRSLADVANYPLNDKQKIGYYFYYHFLERIPRSEIDIIHSQLEILFKDLEWVIAGSYRRGAESSGDIDIIIKATADLNFNQVVYRLLASGLVPDVPGIGKAVLAQGTSKMLTVIQLPNGIARRLDLLWISPEQYPFGLFYFTGSQYFNILMRDIASKKGWTLNEYGLYFEQMVYQTDGSQVKTTYWIDKNGQVLSDMSNIITSEEEILRVLGFTYIEPTARNYTAQQLDQVKQTLL